MTSYISSNLRRQVQQRAKFACEYCLIHEEDTFYGCQVDHIISEKHAGLTELSNLALACTLCNQAKGSDIGSLEQHTDKLIRFYNPRIDQWSNHFRVEQAAISPRSAIGEVTARIFRFNIEDRIEEREVLMQFGRYPPPGTSVL